MTELIDLKTRFYKEILPALKEKMAVKNIMAVPRIAKITINVGIGTYLSRAGKDHSEVINNIALITGQRPIATKTMKSISNFKTKKGQIVGVKVTLRGKRMYDFINKLINVVLPRVRDFRGISRKAFDERGNYTIGLREHSVFPEITVEDMAKVHGMQITISTTAKNKEQTFELLQTMGFPFKKEIEAAGKKKKAGAKDDFAELALTGKEREAAAKPK
ncbi:50S ribosomal protein L5 [Candidatus Peregrinibacteria bacterium]|nr:50S ribosomal protein L5 [Candidatus Peregrinibacteria bacterium]